LPSRNPCLNILKSVIEILTMFSSVLRHYSLCETRETLWSDENARKTSQARCGSAPDPAGGAYSVPQAPYLVGKGLNIHQEPTSRSEWGHAASLRAIFLPRHAASAALAVMRCLCVRLSRSYILPKRINISSNFFNLRIATPF